MGNPVQDGGWLRDSATGALIVSDPARRAATSALAPDTPGPTLWETFPRVQIPSAGVLALTSGQLHVTAMFLEEGVPCVGGDFICGALATALTGRYYELLDKSRNKLAVTADDNTAWAVDAQHPLPWAAGPYLPTYTGLHYLGICEVATTPTSLRNVNARAQALGLSPVLNGSSDTGRTNAASAPATSAAITALTAVPYARLYGA